MLVFCEFWEFWSYRDLVLLYQASWSFIIYLQIWVILKACKGPFIQISGALLLYSFLFSRTLPPQLPAASVFPSFHLHCSPLWDFWLSFVFLSLCMCSWHLSRQQSRTIVRLASPVCLLSGITPVYSHVKKYNYELCFRIQDYAIYLFFQTIRSISKSSLNCQSLWWKTKVIRNRMEKTRKQFLKTWLCIIQRWPCDIRKKSRKSSM